jgi:hypothetical protein
MGLQVTFDLEKVTGVFLKVLFLGKNGSFWSTFEVFNLDELIKDQLELVKNPDVWKYLLLKYFPYPA